MPRRKNQPSKSSVTAAAASSGHASASVGVDAPVVPPEPTALLNLVPQIIATGGDEQTASFTIRTGWDGTLAVTYFGNIVPLATAVERSTVILDAAMEARAVVMDVAMRARMLNAMQQEVALVTRVAFRVSQHTNLYLKQLLHLILLLCRMIPQPHPRISLSLCICFILSILLEAEETRL